MAQLAAPREDRSAFGIVTMCLAVTFFTCIDTSAKWLTLAGIPAMQLVFCRYSVHFLLSLVLYLPREGLGAFHSVRWKIQGLRSLFLLGSTMLNFNALKFLPITLTTSIMFAGPIVVTLLSIPILGERVGLRRMMAVLVGFAGVLVVVHPWGIDFHPAMFLSLGALVCASLYFVLTRMLAGIETTATSQVWSSGLATLCVLPFALSDWVWPQSTLDTSVLFFIGIFGGIGHILATVAHRYADASVLAPVVYLQMVFATLASIFIFATYPTLWTLCGALIIIGAGVYIWRRESLASVERRRMAIPPR